MTKETIEASIRENQGEVLRAVRKHHKRSHVQFAKDLEIDRTALYFYETGKRTIPTTTMYMLWEKYKITPGMVLGLERLRL